MKLWSSKVKRQANKRLPLFTYLAYLMVATTVFTGVTFSGYISTTTGSDTAKVAKFDISTAELTTEDLSLDLSATTTTESVSYSFTVASSSEIVAAYTVTVTLPSALPTGVTMTMTPVALTKVSDTVYTCSSELGFTDIHTWTLTFSGSPETVEADTTLTGIRIGVTAEQID